MMTLVLGQKSVDDGLIEDPIQCRVMLEHGALGRRLAHDLDSLFVELIYHGGRNARDLSPADRG